VDNRGTKRCETLCGQKVSACPDHEPGTTGWKEASHENRACGTCIGFRARVDSPYVDNPHAQPVESLCVGQVSIMHSLVRISPNALSDRDFPE
jgi:hypothetical protein